MGGQGRARRHVRRVEMYGMGSTLFFTHRGGCWIMTTASFCLLCSDAYLKQKCLLMLLATSLLIQEEAHSLVMS